MKIETLICDRCGGEIRFNSDSDRKRLTLNIQQWGHAGNEIFRYNDICDECIEQIKKLRKI